MSELSIALAEHVATRFELRGVLGQGTAGVVYRAFDRRLGKEVALKVLRRAAGRDLSRFKREFRALADVMHPNLVELHELHERNGEWFLTMELVEGMSFIDWTRPGHLVGPERSRADIEQAPLREARLRDALAQLVDAVLALHRAGKLHRDLKPSNVLVTEGGRVALLDFGLVTDDASVDPDGLAVGTPVYMSPEQASNRPLTPASDWYGVGAILYEALTGRRPFEGTAEQVMRRKQTELPVDPRALVPTTAPDLARACLALLHPQPDLRPSAETLLALLTTRPPRIAARSEPPPTFIGRARELAFLGAALDDARRAGAAVLVRGASGIGKTTLVRRFARGLGDRVFVVAGRCFERESVPFKMLDGVVDAIAEVVVGLDAAAVDTIVPPDVGALVRVFPVLRRVGVFATRAAATAPPVNPQELRRRGLGALKALIARLAALRPVLVFVDDAHWGDADSAGFLGGLMHGSEPGVLVVIAHRPEDYLGVISQLRPPLGSLRRGDVRVLDVAALADAEAEQLARELATDADRARAVVAAAGGNPLVLTELARAPLLADSVRIEDVVNERARLLSAGARALLAVSSIAARPLPYEIAAHAAGVPRGQEAVSQLTAARLATLRQVEGQMVLHPAHDFVRTAVLASLDLATRASFHEAIARAFQAIQGPDELDAEAVVEHWLAAGHPGRAARHAVVAARRAEDALAFRRAADLYGVSLAFGAWPPSDERELLRRKAFALGCAGQLDEAASAYAHAAELVRDDEALDLERLRVEALLRCGRLEEGLPAAERLLGQVGHKIALSSRASRARLATQWVAAKLRGLDFEPREPGAIPPRQLVAVDALYSVASGLALVDPALGRVVQAELTRAALDAGEPVRICVALGHELGYAAAAGSRNRAAVEVIARRLRALAQELGKPEILGVAEVATGVAMHLGGRFREARTQLVSGLDILRERGIGVRWEIDVGEAFWLANQFYLGAWHELARDAPRLLREAVERADIVAQHYLRSGRCNLAYLVLDRPDEARAHLAVAERGRASGFHFSEVSLVTAAASIDLYTGDAEAALATLDAAEETFVDIGLRRVQQVRVELAFLRARVLLAHATPDARGARAIGDELIKEGAPWAAGLGHLVRAAAHAAQGHPSAARVELLGAEEQLEAAGMVGFLQIAHLRRGQIEPDLPGAAALADTARAAIGSLGAVNPERLAQLLVPWPQRT